MFNRRQIMTEAWRKHRRHAIPFANTLRLAWEEAKGYDVIGYRICDSSATLLAHRVSLDEAGRVEWYYQYSYDRIERRVA